MVPSARAFPATKPIPAAGHIFLLGNIAAGDPYGSARIRNVPRARRADGRVSARDFRAGDLSQLRNE